MGARRASGDPAFGGANLEASPSGMAESAHLVCRDRSILRGDGGSVTSGPPPWLEARARLGCQTAGELGAPAISSIPNGCQGTSPHQQGRGTKVGEPYNVGIDVSIDRLDVAIRPGGRAFCVTNDAAGWAELVARLPRGTIAAIGLEPSGGYERGVVRALLAAGLSVRRINPNKLRQFARAAGALAKNDRIDARLIADYVTVMPTRVVERNPVLERLAETVTMRRQLCDEHIAVESQASHLEDALLKRIAKRRLTR